MKFVLRSAAILAIASFSAGASENIDGKPNVAKASQTVAQLCSACHGADGNSASPANPSIAGQPAEYITEQLMNFKGGVRNNPVMAGIAATLSSEDMRALGIFFSQQKPKGQVAKDPALALSGQKIYRGGNLSTGVPACAACHLPGGVGIPPRYPRIGGQYAEYVYAQLKAFKAGERGMDKEDKDANGKVMAQIAAKMSEREMQAVAQYVSGLR
ncbi:MAG: cytochrome c4 [Betaproteobacteria bacterium]|nr:MAG: cytochrome c4 [Betaproteobacteria bacterium]